MIKKLLVANRGEIAVRIIRACNELGIETVAVYSTADKESLPVQLAGQAVCVGPPPSAQSYLVQNNLIQAAVKTGCEAVHPGVGFLSENASFARAVTEAGLTFIGPSWQVIDLLGDKVAARRQARQAGLEITPGTEDAVDGLESAEKAAAELGLPVIIKAAAGGGGKGMRIVRECGELAENLSLAIHEAEANFACGRVFIERYVEKPRHVELQILADGAGRVAVLGERDCSVQRNHQKLIEESPSPGIDDAMREKMRRGAVKLFSSLKYTGAGTIEFLVENDRCYFMEVNARVQVEHPVSEFVSGIDIIREQIRCCTEGALDIDPAAVRLSGAAIECRINALSAGTVTKLHVPGGPGVRFDSHLRAGCTIPPYYDAMIAKLIVHDSSRAQAIARMDRCLAELEIEGVATNSAEQRRIIGHPVFQSGVFDTGFYERYIAEMER
ncbi:MAG: ATP-grasp domain-containing protein [Spirochaetaceae bacterium]|jgi:acetyl-CoA carboxylase biotin carboxylase subunit|nr:ATP-grasp domain-containing protein [Spirochaetaceae bacterium]